LGRAITVGVEGERRSKGRRTGAAGGGTLRSTNQLTQGLETLPKKVGLSGTGPLPGTVHLGGSGKPNLERLIRISGSVLRGGISSMETRDKGSLGRRRAWTQRAYVKPEKGLGNRPWGEIRCRKRAVVGQRTLGLNRTGGRQRIGGKNERTDEPAEKKKDQLIHLTIL